jgi:hypothetical protein
VCCRQQRGGGTGTWSGAPSPKNPIRSLPHRAMQSLRAIARALPAAGGASPRPRTALSHALRHMHAAAQTSLARMHFNPPFPPIFPSTCSRSARWCPAAVGQHHAAQGRHRRRVRRREAGQGGRRLVRVCARRAKAPHIFCHSRPQQSAPLTSPYFPPPRPAASTSPSSTTPAPGSGFRPASASRSSRPPSAPSTSLSTVREQSPGPPPPPIPLPPLTPPPPSHPLPPGACGGGASPADVLHKEGQWYEPKYGEGALCHFCHVIIPKTHYPLLPPKRPDELERLQAYPFPEDMTETCVAEIERRVGGQGERGRTSPWLRKRTQLVDGWPLGRARHCTSSSPRPRRNELPHELVCLHS